MNSTTQENDDSSRTTLKLVLAISYLVLFVIGTVGNGTVILMIINILTSMKRNVQAGKRKMMSSTNHVFIYVLGLSIVDLLVILHLPFLVVDLLKGQWLFGVAMCKVYWFGESVNKLLSSFLMTVLSWDRYMAVCSPVRSMKYRSNATALKVLLACTIFATVLLLPVLIEAAVFKIDKFRMIPLADGSRELAQSDLAGTTMSKCMFDADATFTLYTFVIGFAAPAFLIIIFYLQVICALQKSSRNIRGARGITKPDGSSNRVKKVTKRIVAVILFYFLCWTPQWTLNIMSQFNLIAVSWMTPALSAMFFVAHLLVCFNSAANPVLYAYINRELRTQHVMAMHRKRHSVCQQEQRLTQRFQKLCDNILTSLFHRKTHVPLVIEKHVTAAENTSSSTDEDKDDYL
uniref:G_PROTEIN_RECEP_F1_2 domain-containing protein n=1 Tax=Caenorhabditis japonica TaxID=281687 RepID=A0A8R1HU79_CAEJA